MKTSAHRRRGWRSMSDERSLGFMLSSQRMYWLQRRLIRSGISRGRRRAHDVRPPDHVRAYCPSWLFIAASIFSLIAARLKEAGDCMGG